MREDFYDQYFDVEEWHWWFAGRRRIFLSLLDAELGRGPGDRRVLDLGCGKGTMLRQLARYGEAEGVESDTEAVRLCREGGLDVSEAIPPPLPHDSGRFDLVTALDVVEHVVDDAGLVSEIRRVLRPGGIALISVPAFGFLWGDQDEVSHHIRRYTAPTLRELLLAGGFRLRRLTYFNTLLFPAVAAVRVVRRLAPPRRAEPRSDFELARPGRMNDALARVFAAEAGLLAERDLPFGVSLLALAEPAAD